VNKSRTNKGKYPEAPGHGSFEKEVRTGDARDERLVQADDNNTQCITSIIHIIRITGSDGIFELVSGFFKDARHSEQVM
jgi:hypothetical protein